MTGALILADQPTGAGLGVAGVARNDLWLGQPIDFSCAEPGNTTFLWELLDAPLGSVATLTTPTLATTSLTAALIGTYRVRLTTNGGGAGNVQTRVFRVRYNSLGVLTNRGWAYPAPHEIDEESNYTGNTRGYAEPFETILEDVRVNLGVGGGGTQTVKHEGVTQSTLVTTFDFTGAGVTASGAGATATVDIPGETLDSILRIVDVAEWNEFPAPGTDGARRYAVAWAPDAIAFVALDFNTPSGAIYSEDGVEWLPGKLPATAITEKWRSVVAGPGSTICAVANAVSSGFEVLTSTDATTWVSQAAATTGLSWNALAWSTDLSLFAAVGNANGTDNIMTSPDGLAWTNRTEPGGFGGVDAWSAIVWAAPSIAVPTGQFLAVSQGGTGRTMKSLDGVTWTAAGVLADVDAHAVAWNGTLFAVATDSGIYTSPTAVTWTLQPTSTAFTTLHAYYTMVWAAELGLFVAGGDSSEEIAVSKDGITWYSRITHAPGDNYPQGMAWSPTLRAFASGGDATSATMLVSRPPKALNPRETQWVTTDATSTDISLDFAHAKETVVFGRVVVLATCKASGEIAAFEFRCVFLCGVTNNLENNLPVQLLYSQQDNPAWVCTLYRDAFSFVVTVQGVAATEIQWKASFEVISHG